MHSLKESWQSDRMRWTRNPVYPFWVSGVWIPHFPQRARQAASSHWADGFLYALTKFNLFVLSSKQLFFYPNQFDTPLTWDPTTVGLSASKRNTWSRQSPTRTSAKDSDCHTTPCVTTLVSTASHQWQITTGYRSRWLYEDVHGQKAKKVQGNEPQFLNVEDSKSSSYLVFLSLWKCTSWRKKCTSVRKSGKIGDFDKCLSQRHFRTFKLWTSFRDNQILAKIFAILAKILRDRGFIALR